MEMVTFIPPITITMIRIAPAGGLDPACWEAASKVTSWSDWARLLGGGDSDGSTGIGCKKYFINFFYESLLFEAI